MKMREFSILHYVSSEHNHVPYIRYQNASYDNIKIILQVIYLETMANEFLFFHFKTVL